MKKIIASDNDAHDKSYPALQFERLFGLSDIGRYWRMPMDVSMSEMEDFLWADGTLELRDDCDLDTVYGPLMHDAKPEVAKRFLRTQELAQAFIALNPDLGVVRFDENNWGHLRGFVHGIVSGFNTDDLQGWIDDDLDHKGVDELRDLILRQYHLPAEKSWYPENLRMMFNQKSISDYPYIHLEIPCVFWVASTKTLEKIHEQFGLLKQNSVQNSGFSCQQTCAPK